MTISATPDVSKLGRLHTIYGNDLEIWYIYIRLVKVTLLAMGYVGVTVAT